MSDMSEVTNYHCPRCSAELEATGLVEADGAECPVFQCDACQVEVELFGERFRGALTFCVDPAGRPFDPATPDGSLPPPAP
jgi:DNA-directed RNA polymerase subunit RPC12/RpoP